MSTRGRTPPLRSPAGRPDRPRRGRGTANRASTAAAAADAQSSNRPNRRRRRQAGGGRGRGGRREGKKRKIAAFLAYVGKGYQGFQRNPGARTVEDELERAIVAAGGISADNAGDFTKVQWTRAARTDKGVSAVGQLVIALRMVLDPPGVLERINAALPDGFKIFGYKRVTGGSTRRPCGPTGRYEYVIPTFAFDPEALPSPEGGGGGGGARGGGCGAGHRDRRRDGRRREGFRL